MSETNQDMNQGAVKFNIGKPRLELKPPRYWEQVGSELSFDMSLWFFYGTHERELISIDDQRIPYDSTQAWTLGAIKYADHNWLKGDGLPFSAIVGAFHRHVNRFDTEKQLWVPRDLNDINHEYGSTGSLLAEYPHGCAAQWAVEALNEYTALRCGVGINDCQWNVNRSICIGQE